MKLSEKYEKYLVSNFKPEATPLSLDLTAEGWKIFIKESLTPMIEHRLQMRQINDSIWADDYENGRRRVLSLFKINDAFATFKWGWNFDFVPKSSGKKVSWARTDKTIYTHIYELSPDFYATDHTKKKQKARDKTIISRFHINIKNPEKGLKEKIREHQEVFCHLQPFITEYYASTTSYEAILKRIQQNMNNSYYRFMNHDMVISQAFIEKKLGLHEKAIMDFEAIAFSDENVRDEYLKRFMRTV